MASVDIVVPCYKYAHYLEGCVASLLSQRDVDVRVLIVDDASPDDTPEVSARLTAADSRVSYLRNEQNLGMIGTANRGVMEWASADYVVLISADDVLAPGSLARATQLLDAHPDMSMAYGMALMLWDDGPALQPADPTNAETFVVPGKEFIRRVYESGNPVPTPTAVMRTSVQHRIGGYDPAFKHTNDVDTWLRAALAGSIGVVNTVQAFYRWHASNMSAAYQRRPIGDRREMIHIGREFAQRFKAQIPEAQKWCEVMEQRFGLEVIRIASWSYQLLDDETWRDMLKFAQQYYPAYMSNSDWWKLRMKRLIGRNATGALRHMQNPVATPEPRPWYEHGAQIGWWPGEAKTVA